MEQANIVVNRPSTSDRDLMSDALTNSKPGPSVQKRYTILVVNPGSTSTKLAVSEDDRLQHVESVFHSAAELGRFTTIWNQFQYRLELCRQWARGHGSSYDAVASIGGLTMLQDAHANLQGEHASNLGCALAHALADEYRCPAYVVDPVSVDEFESLARYSGHPRIERRSLSHALNLHAAAWRAAKELNVSFSNSSFIVCHLGGGISVAPVKGGRIIDVNDAASDGPFSPERTGGLPLQPFISLCFSGEFTDREMRTMVMGKGGLVAYLGTNSSEEVEARIAQGDARAREVYEAMAYQIAKEIGAMAAVLRGDVDAVILTGGLANSEMLTRWITERVQFVAPVKVYPGEHEMEALASGALRVLRGEEQEKTY